jgi:hypothetical protein
MRVVFRVELIEGEMPDSVRDDGKGSVDIRITEPGSRIEYLHACAVTVLALLRAMRARAKVK